ncbi:hypothetical protein [Geobacter sp. SVR]|uniref:hypothetical protein n=1 Tax=Geobacter sp. SVR TaxID=2495594 RepID=UPI00143EF946|nr:hypothetical protein [Geobacter sp. SVR]BCS53274.1 hypothetical protein GSVR_15820 [Geobacter sp. SVR]GCF85600.1 hypothetical protein GSbR_22000 [Geobacter sp. SVR]
MFNFIPQMFEKNLKNFLISLLALVLAGCGGQAVKPTPVFFPPAPNPPRIQHLMGISRSSDIEGKKSTFSLIMTGKEELDEVKSIMKPYGVMTHKGKIYVCDIGVGNVAIIDPVKKSFNFLKGNNNVGKLKKPANIAVDAEENLYVADVARREIVVYNPAGEYIRAFGREVDMKPTDVAVEGESVYVLDLQKGNNEIKVFDRKSGQFRNSFGKWTSESEGLAMPTNFALDDKGFIYTTNSGSGKVIKFDPDGHILLSFGEMGDIIGKFSRPKGIAVDHENRIYVVDGGNQNVQVFNEKGRLLIFFGDPGLVRGSLNLPVSVSVSRDNLEYYQTLAEPDFILEAVIFVTNQYGAEKISIYGLGQMKGAAANGEGTTETKVAGTADTAKK